MPPTENLSSIMQRIGKEFIAAKDPSTVRIAAEDEHYLTNVLSKLISERTELPFICVVYTYATSAEELGLPSGPLPAFTFLQDAYGSDAYAHRYEARTRKSRFRNDDVSLLEVSGYVRYTRSVDICPDRRNPYFNIVCAHAELLQYVSNMDLSIPAAQEPESPASADELIQDGCLGPSPDELSRQGGAAEPELLEERPELEPGDCWVYLDHYPYDDFRESEYRAIEQIMTAMTTEELVHLYGSIDELWHGPLASREGRLSVQQHPLLRYSIRKGAIITGRLITIQDIAHWQIRKRSYGPECFYDDAEQVKENDDDEDYHY